MSQETQLRVSCHLAPKRLPSQRACCCVSEVSCSDEGFSVGYPAKLMGFSSVFLTHPSGTHRDCATEALIL